MTEDEYEETVRSLPNEATETLQRMARAGWELIKTDRPNYYFRRLLIEETSDEGEPVREDPYRYHTLRLGGNIGSDDIERMLRDGWQQTHSIGHTFHFRRLKAAGSPSPLPTPIPTSTSVAPVNAKLQSQGKLPTPGPVCPHCGERGHVTSRRTKQKAGLSGGKATAAILTGGVSLLVPGVGLSRKVKTTVRHCGKCGSDWTVG